MLLKLVIKVTMCCEIGILCNFIIEEVRTRCPLTIAAVDLNIYLEGYGRLYEFTSASIVLIALTRCASQ